MRRLAAALSLVTLCACAGASPTSNTTDGAAATITMDDNGFAPDTVTVALNQKVCWVNADDEARWPASNIHPTHEIYSDFDPKIPVREGDTWCFTFDQPGIWKFHDHLLPEFIGTVMVE